MDPLCHSVHYVLYVSCPCCIEVSTLCSTCSVGHTVNPVDSVDTTATRDQVGVAKLQQKLVPPRLMRGGVFTVTLLENRVNRFSLRGPLSLTMLKHILPTVDEIDDTMAFGR